MMNPLEFDLKRVAGLAQADAAARLAAEGYNELPAARRRDTLAIALEVVREPMFLLLVAAGSIYLLLGDVHEALVLLEDDFDSIVDAVRLGRRIYSNIRNAMSYLLAVHVPIAGMALIPLLFGWPPVFFPVHIVFFEFVIDPASSIVFEADPIDEDAMRRPPRKPEEHLFGSRTVVLALLQGAAMLLMVVLVCGYVLQRGASDAEARAMAFVTIVLGNLGLILVNRSRSRTIFATLRFPNAALWWVIGCTLLGLLLVLQIAHLRELFRFAPLGAADLLLCAAAAVMGISWPELYKITRPRPARAL